MWMNEWEIDNALDRWYDHPVLGPAVRTLDSLRAQANHKSDGWHVWPKPGRAASKLMDLIEQGRKAEREQGCQLPATPWPAEADLRKALAPVKAFRTRMAWDFKITERLPTRREQLGQEIMDCERTARDHATLADHYLAKAAEYARQLAELPADET